MGLPDIETIPETGAVFTIGRSRFADNIASHFFIRKDPVVGIECGDEHSAVVCQTGRLFVFGSNDWGQLGLGHKNHISKPSCVKILKPEKVTHVACGRAHTLICTGAQKVFACGSNQEGQLGRDSSTIGDSSSSPILIYDGGLAGPKVVQVAAGSHHSMVLTSDGGVVAWGSNLEGQLGLSGISGLVSKPTKVPIPEPVKEISAGYYHSAFLTESGLVYVCGESESGKLGIDVNFSTQVAPKQMQLPAPALHIACGGHHTLVLAENGNIYCSGNNSSGQLGMGTNVNETRKPKLLPRGALKNEKIIKITCGERHSAILTESGKLFTCGDGRHGKLGLEENENNVHEVTFAAKYQELFVSDVACGGCHTILVGRRHEMDYPLQRQPDSPEQAAQKKSSLPPLKLPVNMQNEHRMDNTDKSTNEDDSHHTDKISTDKISTDQISTDQISTDQISEVQKSNDTQTNSSKNSPKKTSDIVNNEEISSSAKDEKITSPKKSSETTSTTLESPKEKAHTPNINSKIEESTRDEDESKNKENVQNDETTESEESKDIKENKSGSQEDNETTKTTEAVAQDAEESRTEVTTTRIQDETEQETSTNPVPPPKPPRLKSGSVEETNNEKGSSRESEEEEREKGKDDEETKIEDEQNSNPISPEKPISAKSKTITEKIMETIENKIENIEEDKHADELEKAEMDGTQDDADVQSPAPRTAKMARLFRGKREQEIQNGTKKSSSTVNPKAKSKTCAVL